MILLLLINVVCICVGVGVAVLASYPLYLGLLAGWLFPAVMLLLAMLPYLLMDKTHRHRRTPFVGAWREQRERKGYLCHFESSLGALATPQTPRQVFLTREI